MQNDMIITNQMWNEFHECEVWRSLFEIVAFSLRECGVAMQCIREIRYKFSACAQPKFV